MTPIQGLLRARLVCAVRGCDPTSETLEPPHSVDAERATLGAIMLTGRFGVARQAVSGESFYVASHRQIWGAMAALHDVGVSVEPITVTESLKDWGRWEEIGGHDAIDALLCAVPDGQALTRYCGVVAEMALLRKLLAETYEVIGRETRCRRCHRPIEEAAV